MMRPGGCYISRYGCEAPARMPVGGLLAGGRTDGETHDCPICGQAVCDSCSDADGVCDYCNEEEEEG